MPTLTGKPGQWAIQARSFRIGCAPLSHNFWTLAEPGGNVVDQLHGLAVDPGTGQAKAIGNSSHRLQVVQDATIAWSLQPGQPVAVCAAGREAEIKARWQTALNAVPALNALQIPYPDLWQHFFRANSNSVFNTLGQIMGFDSPASLLPTVAPGISRILSREIVSRYRYLPLA
ncbi:MAG TPA: hypothetical protein PKA10_06730 [Selenomonadales bacterium]|nr:hypothetical protein [Selenomonadales bacterium]